MDTPTPAADAAWARVTARWDDEDAHRQFLAASAEAGGLDGLAEAGRRYREELSRRPDDPIALRWRDEVVRRATVLAFAQLPPAPLPRRGAARALVLGVSFLLAVAAVAALAFLRLGATR